MPTKSAGKSSGKKEATKKNSPDKKLNKPPEEKTMTSSEEIENYDEGDMEATLGNPDDLEDQDEEAAGGQGGNAAAIAAASGPGEMSASFKNFRHHPDMENFYRFIYENDLRHEALAIIDEIMIEKQQRKLGKK